MRQAFPAVLAVAFWTGVQAARFRVWGTAASVLTRPGIAHPGFAHLPMLATYGLTSINPNPNPVSVVACERFCAPDMSGHSCHVLAPGQSARVRRARPVETPI